MRVEETWLTGRNNSNNRCTNCLAFGDFVALTEKEKEADQTVFSTAFVPSHFSSAARV
jgi:hypothetical protein